MKLPSTPRRPARIEIIPMIDTMFFLLVFFMIATLSMTIQHGLPVNLPTAASATDKIPEEYSLTLTKEGGLYFNKEPLSMEELKTRLTIMGKSAPHPSLVINADEEVPHGRVISVMDLIRTSGLSTISIATKPAGF